MKRINSAKNSPISAFLNAIVPKVQTKLITARDQKRRVAASCITPAQLADAVRYRLITLLRIFALSTAALAGWITANTNTAVKIAVCELRDALIYFAPLMRVNEEAT